MGSQTATLIAALIAAVAAAGSLVVSIITASRRERRDNHRRALDAELPDLADGLHQVVATSFTQHRQLAAGKTQSGANWRGRGQAAAQTLYRVRPRVRYSLSGLDLGLRNLGRLPDWVAYHQGRPEGQELLDHADALASALHEIIEISWRDGRPLSPADRRRVAVLVDELRTHAPIEVREQALVEEPGS
jgi:hypothetical protein